jgi:hypothetical protein
MSRVLPSGCVAILRAVFVLAALWLTSLGPQPATAVESLCPAPTNSCGCVSCGCPAVPQEPSCPPGQVLYDDYCLPSCPDGWQRYPGYPGICLPPCWHGCPEGYEQVPLPYCPPGSHRDLRNPNICVPDFDEPGRDDNCPPGLILSPYTQQCVADCPPGTYLAGEGLCRSTYERECPQGFGRDPQTGRCVPPGQWPPGYEWICLPLCPQGYVRDIEQPTRCLPPPPDCPPGYERGNNGRCLPPCELGTERDPYGYCVPQQCPDGSYSNLRGQCEEPECPYGYDNLRGQCVPPCAEGYSRDNNGRCMPPDEGCPQGTERVNGQCVPPDRGCATGEELFQGQCVPVCGAGTARDANGRCVSTGCPSGEEKVNGKCVPRCEKPLQRDAKGRCVCPPGTDTVQGRCVPKCREGLIRDGNGRCVCPQGSEFIGGRCEPECKQGLVRDRKGRCVPPACGEGEERVLGRCVPQCPPSFVRDKRGKCVCPRGEQVGPSGTCETAQQGCPEGYRRNENGECVRINKQPRGCPEGYVYSKRYKTCLPEPDQGQPNQRLPDLNIDPGNLNRLINPKLIRPGTQEQPQ